MSKILKKNTAILQVPEKVINEKNKLINSTTNKGDLKKGTIKIQTGKNLKIVSKGTLIKQEKEVKPKPTKKPKPIKEVKPKPTKEVKPKPTKEPEIYKANYENETSPIKPLTEKELKKKFNIEIYGNVDSIEKFNKLKFGDKFHIEFNVEKNGDIIDNARNQFVEDNYGYYTEFDDEKFDRAVDKYSNIFYKMIKKLRKKSKSEFLNFINNNYSNVKDYRFIF